MTITSWVLEHLQTHGQEKAIEMISGISPIARQHVNLFGRFDFQKTGTVNLEKLVQVFAKPDCWVRITREADVGNEGGQHAVTPRGARNLTVLERWAKYPTCQRVTAGLNKGELKNTLARAVCFNRLGELRDRTFDA